MKDKDYGREVFNKIFELKNKELKKELKKIIGGDNYDVIDNAYVKKTLGNDVPSEIRLSYYDSYIINSTGIYFEPELGGTVLIRKFDKYFKYE
jgi:hypothetical protein